MSKIKTKNDTRPECVDFISILIKQIRKMSNIKPLVLKLAWYIITSYLFIRDRLQTVEILFR